MQKGRWVGAGLGLRTLALFMGRVHAAQQGPIGQIEGGGGAAADGGSGGGALAISLPEERHGLPVPVALGFNGGAEVGEAGVDWRLPLSFVSVNETRRTATTARTSRSSVALSGWTLPVAYSMTNGTFTVTNKLVE